MLREETDNERLDCAVPKADVRAINNHRRKGLNCLDRQFSDSVHNMVQKRKEICAAENDEDDEDEREIDEDRTEKEDAEMTRRTDANRESEREDAQIAECAICHVHVDETNFGRSVVVDSEQNSRCPERYLVCQRCVRKISVQSGAQEQRSHASFSVRNRDDSCDDRARSKRIYDSPMYLQFQSRSVSDARRDVRRHTTLFARKSSEAIDSDAGSHVADLWREEQSDSYRRQCQQQYGCCNPITRRYNAADGSCNSEIKTKSHFLASSVEHSRKPIRCPRMDCSVNVAFSALTHHFLFDHPEVPILSVEPGAESTLIVSYDALSCNSSRCLALLLVSGKLSDSAARLFGGNQINPKYRNRLPLPVLAARLHNNRGYASCEEIHAGGEGQCEKDVIVAWVAGLDVGDTNDRLRCSIQAVDNIENGGFRSLTYTGPVMSLRAAQCPRDVFLAGDCIVLHEGLISHITSGCTSLNVNVIVH